MALWSKPSAMPSWRPSSSRQMPFRRSLICRGRLMSSTPASRPATTSSSRLAHTEDRASPSRPTTAWTTLGAPSTLPLVSRASQPAKTSSSLDPSMTSRRCGPSSINATGTSVTCRPGYGAWTICTISVGTPATDCIRAAPARNMPNRRLAPVTPTGWLLPSSARAMASKP